MGEGLAVSVVLTRRPMGEVKDGCSGAFDAIERGDVDVDGIRDLVGVKVWVCAVSVVEDVKALRRAVDVFSSKSAGDEEKKGSPELLYKRDI